MKKTKKSNKGFTLTELAIVIAVIAILIAVLVPTFVSLINKANESNDKQLVKNLNTSLSTNINIETPADALDAVAADGYSVDKLKTSSNCEIIYDEAATMFVLLTDGTVSYPSDHTVDLEAATTWYFVSSQSEIAENATVSYFISGDWSTSTASAQTAQTAKYSVKKAAATTASGTVTYKGAGGVDTSRATGIATVNYTYTGTSTGATVILNVVDAAVVVDLSSATGSVEIKNYGNENSTIAVKGETNASVTLSNNNDAACYIQEDVSISYSGETEATTVKTVDSTSGTLEAGTKAYPYILASKDDIDSKLSYGGYYQLTASFEYTDAITIESGNEVTLDLNGYTLTVSGKDVAVTVSSTDYYAGIINNGTLTIKDSNENGEIILSGAAYGIYNVGNFVLENGKINAIYSNAYAFMNFANDAVITINNGEVIGVKRGINNNKGTLTVNGDTISNTSNTDNNYCGIYNNSSLNVNGGKIEGYNGIYSYTAGTVNITNCEIISGSHFGIFTYGITNINGGTVSGVDYGVYAYGTSANVTIGGTAYITATGEGLTKPTDEDEYNFITGVGIYKGATCTIEEGTTISLSDIEDLKTCSVGVEVIGPGAVNEGETQYYSTLVVNGGTISAGTYGITGNGSEPTGTSTKDCRYTKITINGGSISGAHGIYHPQVGELVINGGTITGSTTGIEIRSGTLTVYDGATIKSTAKYEDSTGNGNGTTTDGAAIAIVQHTTKNYVTVNIYGGTFSGYNALFENNTQENTYGDNDCYENYITVNISGGTFTSTYTDKSGVAVYGTSIDTITITGGTFNTTPSTFVDTDSYTITTNEDSTYTVTEK